jgi:uncharacterized protein with beta-barrel porin domain
MSKMIKIICFLAFASTSNLAYAVNIATNSDITFSFTEAVRLIDNTILTNENVGSLITLKNTDASGTNLSFTATVNSAKTIITINPNNNFTSGQIIYAYIGATVEDFNDNVIPATSKTFTAEYLVADLTNPLDNEDFVGLLNAQTETAKRFIQQSTTSVLKRMEWLRRNKNENELSHQGVSVNFIDADFNNLSNTLQFSNFLNQSADLFSNNWAVWSEGNITLGEVDANGDSSLRDVKTNGITFGIDNKIDANHILGLALRIGKDNVDVGSLGNALDTDTYSLSLYGTMPYDDKTYIDGTLGISLLDMNLTRSHASGTLTGSREGKQLFGSLVYSAALEENLIKITPYGRIDGGYTILSSFSDTGTVAAIKYDEQKITSAMISLGILVDDEIEISNLKLNRYGRLEYGKDISSSSDATVSYVAVPNTKYILSIDDEVSNNIRAAFGTDIETQYKWSYQFDYEVNYRSGSSHLNTFSVAVFYELGLDSIISLSLDSELSTHSIAKLELDTRLKNGWFLNGAYEMKDYKDLSNENILRLQAVRYF